MATDTSLRVHAPAAETFRALAEREGKTLTRYLDELAKRERARVFWEDLRAAAERPGGVGRNKLLHAGRDTVGFDRCPPEVTEEQATTHIELARTLIERAGTAPGRGL